MQVEINRASPGAPVFAQAAIQEPGAFAFYHPDADVLNGGQPTPAAAADAMAALRFCNSDAYAFMDGSANSSSCAERYRSFDPASTVTAIRVSELGLEPFPFRLYRNGALDS
jgi:hypothetical protein